MRATRINDQEIPKNPGEWSLNRSIFRPPYGSRDEIFMMTPHGRVGALIPEVHNWKIDENDNITVNPSIIYFNYHGLLRESEWSP